MSISPLLIDLLKTWIIGIIIVAPIGTVSVLSIRKTLELGFMGGLAVGFGAALADSTYGLVATVGLNVISHLLLERMAFIKIIGGLFLIYWAYIEIKSISSQDMEYFGETKQLSKVISKVFLLTISNPIMIFTFMGIFVTIGGASITIKESLVMVIGIFLGSMTWWIILGSVIVKIKHKLRESWLHRIRYITAFMLGCLGLMAIFSGLLAV